MLSSAATKKLAMANVALLLWPVIMGMLKWFARIAFLSRFAAGVFLGLVISALFHSAHQYRSQFRRAKALWIAQVCRVGSISFTKKASPSWLPQPSGYEKVDWLNMELDEVWPSLNEAVSGLLKLILQSVLDPYKFSIIQKITIKSITLGTVSPQLGGVKFSSCGEDEVILEVELDWRHSQDSKIVIQLQTTGPLLTVQLRDFVVFGVLKLIFKPLKEEFPGFGAVTMSLKEPPVVDFITQFLGGDILAIPGVDNAVDNIILTALTDILVWPNRLVIPVIQGDYSFLMLKPVGQVEVELLEAQDVAKLDLWGESDPYALIYIRRKQGCMWTSSTKMNTSSPVWNEKHIFDVEDLESQKLTIQLFDYDRFSGDDFIGIVQFPLSKMEPEAQEDVWLDLVQDLAKDEPALKGKVHVRLTYRPLLSDKGAEEMLINEEQLKHDDGIEEKKTIPE